MIHGFRASLQRKKNLMQKANDDKQKKERVESNKCKKSNDKGNFWLVLCISGF